MRKYRQVDEQWSRDTLGKTNYTIGRWGCTITCICMLWTRFYKDDFLPSRAAKQFKFTNDGRLYWSSDFSGMKFIRRGYGDPAKELMKEYVSKEKGMIIEVNYTHWVVLYYNGFLGPYILDPLDGKMKRLYKHYRPTGYALFSKLTDDL